MEGRKGAGMLKKPRATFPWTILGLTTWADYTKRMVDLWKTQC